jgi:hypothetical protein
LVELEPRAVLRSGVGRYRDLHVATDEAWLADMVDLDGIRLGRAALRLLEPADAGVPAVEALPIAVATDHRVVAPSAAAIPRARADAATDRSWTWPITIAAVAVMGLLLVARRRHQPPRRPPAPALRAAAPKRR